MATYSTEQLEILRQVKQLLNNGGLSTNDLTEALNSSPSAAEDPVIAEDLVILNHSPGITRTLSPEELDNGEGRITRKSSSSVHAIAEHSLDAIVEFPESGSLPGLAVAHIFPINASDSWVHPKDNFQYSLGDKHGQSYNIRCHLLARYSKSKTPVLCTKLRRSCRSIKRCTFNTGHQNTSDVSMPHANKEVFNKTLGFYCALNERGCRLDMLPDPESDSEEEEDREKQEDADGEKDADGETDEDDGEKDADGETDEDDGEKGVDDGEKITDDGGNNEDVSEKNGETEGSGEKHKEGGKHEGHGETNEDLIWVLTNSRASNSVQTRRCDGKFILEFENNGRPRIRCEHYTRGQRGHLVLRNLIEFDINYLKALMNNDSSLISAYELEAFANGYGPLAPCGLTFAYHEQKELCPAWHRNHAGKIQRGELVKLNDCPAHFEIYEPNDLHDCPYILVVCRNPHSHPNPPRTRTPASIRLKFNTLLYQLEWRLTDATPRRLLLDSGFVSDLRRLLNWQSVYDPTLSDLHPSFANQDHTGRLINILRSELYPKGTGFEGAKYLISEHPDKQTYGIYIRHIQEHTIPTGKKIYIVICMFPAMSYLFHRTNRPSIDTSFKRLHRWQEFEVEAWFPEFARSLVVARAFTTSQSAEAHLILFREMFKIVKLDTGKAVHFRHIHGDGFDTITADGHRGQAVGLGLYLREICADMKATSTEWKKPMNRLTPAEHLACIYRYCFAHYVRNINKLRNSVSSEVRAAMMSLASAEPLPDLQGVLKRIRSGGKKAAKWLKDKEASKGITLAGIYRPKSKIPIEIWRAAPTTSNGNEQAHRSINRDGTQLTMLAGIMRGFQYDSRAIQSYHMLKEEGVHTRDQDSSSFRRAGKAIGKKERDQRKIVEVNDKKIAQMNQRIIQLQQTVQKNAKGTKRALKSKSAKKINTAVKRLRNSNKLLQKTNGEFEKLKAQGSGRIVPSGIVPDQDLFDRELLDVSTQSEPDSEQEKSESASDSSSCLSTSASPPASHSQLATNPQKSTNPYPSSSHIPQTQPLLQPPRNHIAQPRSLSAHPPVGQYSRNNAHNRPSNPYPLPPLTRPSNPYPLPPLPQSSNAYPSPPLPQSLQPPSYQSMTPTGTQMTDYYHSKNDCI